MSLIFISWNLHFPSMAVCHSYIRWSLKWLQNKYITLKKLYAPSNESSCKWTKCRSPVKCYSFIQPTCRFNKNTRCMFWNMYACATIYRDCLKQTKLIKLLVLLNRWTIKIKASFVATGCGVTGIMEGCQICSHVWWETGGLVGQRDCCVWPWLRWPSTTIHCCVNTLTDYHTKW